MDTMNTIDLTINNCSPHDLQVISSINTDEDNTKTEVDCESNLYNDKVFSDEGMCLFEGSYTISENSNPGQQICEEMIDFEALIDSISGNNAVVTLPNNIKEFESVLSNFDTTSAVNLEEDLTLNEIDNFFDSVTADVDLKPQEIPDVNLNPQELLDVDLNPEDILDISNNICSEHIKENIRHTITTDVDFKPQKILDIELNSQELLDVHLNPQDLLDISNNISSEDIKENIIQNVFNENPTENSEKQDDIQNNNENTQENNTIHTMPAISIKEDISKDNIIEVISVSSETSQSADDGYNSSDFEFITEEEATIEGYIVNFRRNNVPDTKPNNTKNKINVKKNISIKKLKVTKSKVKNRDQHNFDRDNCQSENRNSYVDPGEGPSGLNLSNRVSHTNHLSNSHESSSRSEDLNSHIDCQGSSGLKTSDRPFRPNHIIPEGEGYLDLFRGPYDPVLPLSDIIFMENKSIRPSAMNTQYEGVGFDQQLIGRRYQPDSSEEEYVDEAKESAKMILSMYPDENRRRKSRRH